MEYPKRKWKIYLVHHAHTDLGYTDRQEKIQKNHVNYIRQVLEITRNIRNGTTKEYEGFKWTCETFWAVEEFLKKAAPQEKEEFIAALKRGDIEYSATYLNMTELAGYELFRKMTARAVEFGREIGIQVKSAMTADVNGLSWGWSEALAELGIENFFSCVHTHHGMYPLNKKLTPFYWETPNGKRILVWNGEHYHLGNEFGIMPDALTSYTIRDEFSTEGIVNNQKEISETRLSRYLSMLESEGYPYDFVPITVHGILTDNAPPNPRIMEFVNKWNALHGNSIEFEVTTLTPFFNVLKEQAQDIPVYRGDWPDWWSDGVASTARHTTIYRQAQRTWELVNRLNKKNKVVDQELLERTADNLMAFAEHTWGYHTSVSEPFNPMVHIMEARKQAYASEASRLACSALDDALEKIGEEALAYNRVLRYKIINPWEYVVDEIVHLDVDHWELPIIRAGLELKEEATGIFHPYQLEKFSRGFSVCVKMKLLPGEEKILRIVPAKKQKTVTTSSYLLGGADGAVDIMPGIEHSAVNSGVRHNMDHDMSHANNHDQYVDISEHSLETQYVKLRWEKDKGIVSWFDKQQGVELINPDAIYGAFTPVYEVSPVDSADGICYTRTKMGRNRKGLNVKRSHGRLVNIRKGIKGELFSTVELFFEVEGSNHYSVILTVYSGMPRLDAAIRIQKQSVWEPENMYISLPFNSEKAGFKQIWLDKGGVLVRPWVDQLPGTLTDFYCIQEGLVISSAKMGIAIATPDAPLIQTGSLNYGRRLLHGHPELEARKPEIYSWILNNIWETNFKASCEGFYEFRYMLVWGSEFIDPILGIKKCASMNRGLVSMRIK